MDYITGSAQIDLRRWERSTLPSTIDVSITKR